MKDDKNNLIENEVKTSPKRMPIDIKDEAAVEALINANEGLVKSIAVKYADWSGLELPDLMQEGILGLLKAVNTFNPDKAAFSTHAANHIRWSILEAIKEAGNAIKIPANLLSRVWEAERIRKELKKEDHDGEFDHSGFDEAMEVAEEMGIPKDEAEYLLGLSETAKVESLDAPIKEDGNITLGETIPADEIEYALETEIANHNSKLNDILKTLPRPLSKIIELRYGLKDGKPLTYCEISGMLGVTRETIIEIEAKALRMLRHPSRRKFWSGR